MGISRIATAMFIVASRPNLARAIYRGLPCRTFRIARSAPEARHTASPRRSISPALRASVRGASVVNLAQSSRHDGDGEQAHRACQAATPRTRVRERKDRMANELSADDAQGRASSRSTSSRARELPDSLLIDLDERDEFPEELVRRMSSGEELGIQLLFVPFEYGGHGRRRVRRVPHLRADGGDRPRARDVGARHVPRQRSDPGRRHRGAEARAT